MPSEEGLASVREHCGNISGGLQRFRDLGVFRLAMRNVDRYMPWVRTIFVVTPGGVAPDWLNTDDAQVKVIDQQSLFPPGKLQDILPVHNSQQVEVYLHTIPGLAEHFIYFNDDMYPGRPLQP